MSFILKCLVFGLTSIFSFFIIQFFHYGLNIESVLVFLNEHTSLSILSVIIIFLVQLPITILVGNVYMGSIITGLLSSIIGFGNYQKMLYRPEPLYPSDVLMLKDIKFLLFSIENKDRILLLVGLFSIIVFLFVLSKKVYSKREVSLKIFALRMTVFFFSIGLLYPVASFGKSNNIVKNIFEDYGEAQWIPFNQIKNYDQNGVIAGLLYNLSSEVIERPTDYSKERVKEIVMKYEEIAKEENKNRTGSLEDINIVYVMNESFADPFQLEGWTITPDPLPNYREIIKETSSGQMLSQGYGGGTANIEFEALSGISMEPMLPNISSAYTQLTSKMKHVPTLLTYFNNVETNQRRKTAIHPFQSSMYKRPEVYESFGFDEMIFEEDMIYTKKIREQSVYI